MQPTHKHHALAHGTGNGAAHDNVGDGEAAARLEHAKRLAQDAVLVGREIDDAVGDDDVDRVVGQGNVFDLAFEKLDVFDACLALVFAGQGEHVVGHVEAVSLAAGSHAARGEQHVDAAAGAEVEHNVTGLEIDERGGIAAAQRGLHGLLGDEALFAVAVEIGGDGVAAAQAGIATCLQTACLRYGARRAAILLLHLLFYFRRGCHSGPPSYMLKQIYSWRFIFVKAYI